MDFPESLPIFWKHPMNIQSPSPLTNPVWHALHTVHSCFATGNSKLLKYPSDVLVLMGARDPEHTDLNETAGLFAAGSQVFMVGELPPVPQNWSVTLDIECLQMVYQGCEYTDAETVDEIIRLGVHDAQEMLELVNRVQPGFYQLKTLQLGNYFGIRKAGVLVSMAGERLKLSGYTEISAVGTLPEYTGRGYARRLMSHLANNTIREGNIPFLHVRSNNSRAIRVYERLGYIESRKIHFSQLCCHSLLTTKTTSS